MTDEIDPGFRASGLPGDGAFWAELTRDLRRRGAGQDHFDDVQEAVTKLWSRARAGPKPAADGAAVALGLFIIRCLKIDRFRRRKRKLRLLGNDDVEVPDRSEAQGE